MIPLKKSNIISFFIFITILIALLINYLVFKTEIDYFKKQYNTNLKIIKNSNQKCFLVNEAYIIPRKDYFELFIFLPYKTIPKDYLKDIVLLNNNAYYLKRANKIYLNGEEISKQLFIKNVNICVE